MGRAGRTAMKADGDRRRKITRPFRGKARHDSNPARTAADHTAGMANHIQGRFKPALCRSKWEKLSTVTVKVKSKLVAAGLNIPAVYFAKTEARLNLPMT